MTRTTATTTTLTTTTSRVQTNSPRPVTRRRGRLLRHYTGDGISIPISGRVPLSFNMTWPDDGRPFTLYDFSGIDYDKMMVFFRSTLFPRWVDLLDEPGICAIAQNIIANAFQYNNTGYICASWVTMNRLT